jgi:hypothetical protein
MDLTFQNRIDYSANCRGTNLIDYLKYLSGYLEEEMSMPSETRLLVCTVPEMLDTARKSLGNRYDCRFSLSVNDACSYLNAKPHAILCNVHFDDGRLFDFLLYVKAHPHGRTVPIIVSQSRPTLTPPMIKGIEAASRSIGIAAFIEIFEWTQAYGPDEASIRVRATIDKILAGTRNALPEVDSNLPSEH